MSETGAFRVAAAPGIRPRLLRVRPGREEFGEYVAAGGYRDLPDAGELLTTVEAAGLRGRGGASFPTAVKLRAVAEAGRSPVVVANGEEGEPASVKDRWLLRNRPHLVLDGVRLAAHVVGANEAWVYVSDMDSERSVESALGERSQDRLTVRVHRVEPSYVAGEETAAVRALNGGPAKPSEKPPRPFESGVDGRPTLVSNVETLANLPFLAARGASAFREHGTDRAPGTFLLTIGGAVREPGLYEVPLGISLAEAVDRIAGRTGPIAGALLGGYFSGLLGPSAEHASLDYESLLERGSGLGCGAVTVLGPEHCPVAVAADVMGYFSQENAGQCGSCFNGTAAMSAALNAIRGGFGDHTDVARLERWSRVLRGRGACATLDGATNLAASLLREFRESVDEHARGTSCTACTAPAEPRPFALEFDLEVPA